MNIPRLLAAAVLFGTAVPVLAAGPPQPSRTSIRYHEYRGAKSIPPYSLAKVRGIVRHIKADNEGSAPLNNKTWNSLSTNEKFTYVMIHAEDSDQNCDASPGILNEERKIFAYVPSAWDDVATWSKRETAFLKENRTVVIGLMRDTIRRQQRVGANFKDAIEELGAWELIPDMAAVYRADRRDHDILTVMMILMKNAKYQPFTSTHMCQRLFGDKALFGESIPASPVNQKFILDHAEAFYRSRHRG
jgi:hypothetical protein